jgi:hypothetical protein
MTGQVFQSFWFGALSPYERLCIQSFLDNGHRFQLYAYDDRLAVPPGTELLDASQIYPRERLFTYPDGPKKGSVSAFANLFRWKLLFERGGWWVDTDVICLRPDMPEADLFFAYEDDQRINCAVMRFPPRHVVIARCLTYSERLGPNLGWWGQTGPRALTTNIIAVGLHTRVAPTQLVYPIHYREAMAILDPKARNGIVARTNGAYFFHLWNEMLRQSGVDKHQPPPAGSWLADQVQRHPSPRPAPAL